MGAAEFEAAARLARGQAEARRAREVRRGVGSTAAARRIGGFSPGSGPLGVAGGDFAEELAVEHDILLASMRISASALSFAGLAPRGAAAGSEAEAEAEAEAEGGETEAFGDGQQQPPQQQQKQQQQQEQQQRQQQKEPLINDASAYIDAETPSPSAAGRAPDTADATAGALGSMPAEVAATEMEATAAEAPPGEKAWADQLECALARIGQDVASAEDGVGEAAAPRAPLQGGGCRWTWDG